MDQILVYREEDLQTQKSILLRRTRDWSTTYIGPLNETSFLDYESNIGANWIREETG